MTHPLDRARQLVAKAIDPATTEEEARTVALIAVKLIAQHQMLDAAAHGRPAAQPRPQPGPPPGGPFATGGSPFPGGPFGSPFGAGGIPPFLWTIWQEILTGQARRSGAGPFRPQGSQPAEPDDDVEQGHDAEQDEMPRRRNVRASYPRARRTEGWWDRLPCELWIYAERQCEVCKHACAEGELVWAFSLDPKSNARRPLVAHIKCRDKLPAEYRQPSPR